MIHLKFKNLKKSEFIKKSVIDKLTSMVTNFQDLKTSSMTLTLEVQHSPSQLQHDLFSVKAFVKEGKDKSITLTKTRNNVYVALSDLNEHMLELLNRAGDHLRTKKMAKSRKFNQSLI
jgi:hypothetical protein